MKIKKALLLSVLFMSLTSCSKNNHVTQEEWDKAFLFENTDNFSYSYTEYNDKNKLFVKFKFLVNKNSFNYIDYYGENKDKTYEYVYDENSGKYYTNMLLGEDGEIIDSWSESRLEFPNIYDNRVNDICSFTKEFINQYPFYSYDSFNDYYQCINLLNSGTKIVYQIKFDGKFLKEVKKMSYESEYSDYHLYKTEIYEIFDIGKTKIKIPKVN